MNDKGTIKVLLVQTRKEPKVIEIEDSLSAMQGIVGGHIEEYMPFEDDVALVCNEEGKMIGLELNRGITNEEGHLQDIISGDFFVCYAPIESESFLSMPDEMMEKYKEKFKEPEKFVKINGELHAYPLKLERENMER